MCGIVGVVSARPAAPVLVEALGRLEYRGYDSAGIATLGDGAIVRRRAVGKLAALADRLAAEPAAGTVGIGHTRWATHGPATEANAHPHVAGRVAVVHNGVIENHRALRAELEAAGCVFSSDTDTEVVAHLCRRALADGRAPLTAVRETVGRLEGAFALVFLMEGEDRLVCARRGSPLAIGIGFGEAFVGSDAIALAPLTDRILYLEDGDVAEVTRDGATVLGIDGTPIRRQVHIVDAAPALVGRNGHRHFMAKEIAEQPEVLARVLAAWTGPERPAARALATVDWAALEGLTLVGCGTAHHAGQVAKYWIEGLAGLPVETDIASEYRYREPPVRRGGLALFVSQSGETADTLAALRQARMTGQPTAALVNVPTSTMAREADIVLPLLAGPEIGVASTKAFTAQLVSLAALALHAARERGRPDAGDTARHETALARLPSAVAAALRLAGPLSALAAELARAPDVLFVGRGAMYPLALEAALKLKELTYVPAQGYAAGELKHGPIALVDDTRPVVAFAPQGPLLAKTLSNLAEIAARSGRVALVTDAEGAREAGSGFWRTIVMPTVDPFVAPVVHAVAAQLLAYHAALATGRDVDQPRNLAKSVTVE